MKGHADVDCLVRRACAGMGLALRACLCRRAPGMTLPRPAVIAILALALVATGLMVVRGLGGGTSSEPSGTPPSGTPRVGAARPSSPSAPPAQLPERVRRALIARRPLVLLFADDAGADDAAARRAVRSLRARRSDVAVFSDEIGEVGRYRDILAGLPISQVPAIVIVPRERRARLVEGFVDEASLRQDVADVVG